MDRLFLDITYPLTGDFTIASNIKEEQRADVLADFLRAQLSAGPDSRPPRQADTYHIRIDLDLDGDVFQARCDTGNYGLRDGILLDVLARLQTGAAAR